jgi:hypothetical protein
MNKFSTVQQWPPDLGQSDKRLRYAAIRWSALPKYTTSGIQRTSDWCRRSVLQNAKPSIARLTAYARQA